MMIGEEASSVHNDEFNPQQAKEVITRLFKEEPDLYAGFKFGHAYLEAKRNYNLVIFNQVDKLVKKVQTEGANSGVLGFLYQVLGRKAAESASPFDVQEDTNHSLAELETARRKVNLLLEQMRQKGLTSYRLGDSQLVMTINGVSHYDYESSILSDSSLRGLKFAPTICILTDPGGKGIAIDKEKDPGKFNILQGLMFREGLEQQLLGIGLSSEETSKFINSAMQEAQPPKPQ